MTLNTTSVSHCTVHPLPAMGLSLQVCCLLLWRWKHLSRYSPKGGRFQTSQNIKTGSTHHVSSADLQKVISMYKNSVIIDCGSNPDTPKLLGLTQLTYFVLYNNSVLYFILLSLCLGFCCGQIEIHAAFQTIRQTRPFTITLKYKFFPLMQTDDTIILYLNGLYSVG